MQGMVELGEEIFHMPVRIGQPQYSGGLAEVVRNPRYSTAVGLLLAGMQQHRQQQIARMQIGSLPAGAGTHEDVVRGKFLGGALGNHGMNQQHCDPVVYQLFIAYLNVTKGGQYV